jgi:hypothetical protein
MNLKKSDKIIAAVGVIILIIAAVGIFFYVSTEEVEEVVTEPEEKTFYVTWTKETGEIPLDGYAGKKAPYNQAHTVTAFGGVLTSADFQLTWEDDCTYFGIFSKGLDKLTAEISMTDGEPQPPQSSVGSGDMTFPFSVNDIPMVDSVEAEDIFEAEEIINEMFSGQGVTSFDVTVTVSTGEKLRRPLKFLKDKGNSFELKIIYEYYSPMIEEEYGEDYGEEENAVGEEGYEYQGVLGLFYKNLYCGRGWI